MLIELPNLVVVVINVLGIPIAHLVIAFLSLKLPESLFFKKDGMASDEDISFYQKICIVPKWKRWLPDGSKIVGGFSKANLKAMDSAYLQTFIMETRRGQFSHWIQLIVIAGFIAWNPWPANVIIVIYAFTSNMPCILNLRYTELRLRRMLRKKQ